MDFTLIYLFFLGATLSFLGTIPLGPINLSVVNATIKYHISAAFWMAGGAAVVEIVNSFIALYCNAYVKQIYDTGIWTRLITAFLFIALGVFFFLQKKKPRPQEVNAQKSNHHFIKGIGVAMLNLQAIPFWIYIFASLKSLHPGGFGPQMPASEIFWLLMGVALGKFLALAGFGWLSQQIEKKASRLQMYMNKIIACILMTIGIVQALRTFLDVDM